MFYHGSEMTGRRLHVSKCATEAPWQARRRSGGVKRWWVHWKDAMP